MNILENFRFDRFLYSLQYMWKGMLCIFLVIAVIVLAVVIMNSITEKVAAAKQKKEEQSEDPSNG